MTLEHLRSSLVRSNLLDDRNYRPYVGCEHMNRARFNGKQFDCSCGWHTTYEDEFIAAWKKQHNLPEDFADPAEWHPHGVPNFYVHLEARLRAAQMRSKTGAQITAIQTLKEQS